MSNSQYVHNKKSLYYIRAKNFIEDILQNHDFQLDIHKVYKEKMTMNELVLKYHIISSTYLVLSGYASDPVNNEINFDLIVPPVKTYTNDDKILMEISPDITQPELKDYVLKHFTDEIKPHLLGSELKSSRKSIRQGYTSINSKIFIMHDIGASPKQIAESTGLSLEKVKSTLSRRKHPPEHTVRKYKKELNRLEKEFKSKESKKGTDKKPL